MKSTFNHEDHEGHEESKEGQEIWILGQMLPYLKGAGMSMIKQGEALPNNFMVFMVK